MTFPWKRNGSQRGKKRVSKGISNMELKIPTHFRCPISLDLMRDPVTLSTGITYDRESIERWIDGGNRSCPVTNQVLRNFDLIPNHSIRKMIQDWCVENKSYGIERIPTPRTPVTPFEVSEICSRMLAATRCEDARKVEELLGRIKNLVKESERNKRCIAGNGAGSALAVSFEFFASISIDKYADLLKEILSALVWMFPLKEEGKSKLGSATSLRCMAWFLKREDLSSRKSAILVLKEMMISADQDCVTGLSEIEGIAETLFQNMKVRICSSATKACLMVIYHMALSAKGDLIRLKFIQTGLVALVLELLVDGDNGTCERALGVLDVMCDLQEGRECAHNNALTLPLLVKKIFRVSDAATEFSVSIIWKLCMKEDENALIETLELGAFQKLLVVLQVGCEERTKEKVTELLKVMNLYRDKLDCFDSSMRFKYIKRSN